MRRVVIATPDGSSSIRYATSPEMAELIVVEEQGKGNYAHAHVDPMDALLDQFIH